MIEPWWRTLLREQQGSGFADISGADGAIVLPVSDRLLTALVAQRLPPSVPIAHLELHAEADNYFSARVKLKAPAFLPAFTIRFVIVQQPILPDSPYLGIALVAQGMSAMMGTVLRNFATLPAWVRFADQRLSVDVRLLAAQYGATDYFRYLTELELTTAPQRFVLSVRASLPPAG